MGTEDVHFGRFLKQIAQGSFKNLVFKKNSSKIQEKFKKNRKYLMRKISNEKNIEIK